MEAVERKRKISAEGPGEGEEEDEVIGPMPASAAKGAKKRKGEKMAGNSKFPF